MSATNRQIKTTIVPTAGSARRRLLLVDDSRAHRRLLAIQLVRAGYDVVEAGSAQEALEICHSNPPDIVLSDWMMPGMSGPEFCREFRSMPRDGYGYFILLTSKTEKGDIAFGLEAGADDFLTKPVAGAELLARLAAGERVLRFQEELRASNAHLQSALDQLRLAHEAMDRDLGEARKLQQGLVRERSARFSAFDLSLLLRPAGHIGGDLVGFFRINDHRAGIFAIDVSGHGVAAALMTAQLAAHLSGSTEQNVALRAAEPGGDAVLPGQLARFFNNMLLEEMQAETYFTMIYADLDHVTGDLRMIQAGHPHPVLQRADGSVSLLGRGGMPVGLFEDPCFDEIHVRLEPGDRVLIVSDGITESVNPAGRQLGEDGLEAIMRTNAFLTGHSFLESMSWSVSEYVKGQRGDDVSAVLIEHRPLGQTIPLPPR